MYSRRRGLVFKYHFLIFHDLTALFIFLYCAGGDGETLEQFEAHLDTNLAALRNEVQ